MKKILLIFLSACFILCGCDSKDTQSGAPLSINKTELNLTVGQSDRLEVLNAQNVEWLSSNPKVARVYYGAVTAISEGTATITATANGQTFECNIIVNQDESSSQAQTTSSSASSQNAVASSQATTSPIESIAQSEDNSSEQTYSEKVEASKNTALSLIERITNEKYDKAIADLTKECNDIIEGYKKDLAEKQARLDVVGEKSAEGFILKDSIKVLNESIANTEKILKDGVESLERQRKEEHEKNKKDFEEE